MTKTFKIGEYAIGGIIVVTIKGKINITARDWNTRQIVETKDFDLFAIDQIESYLCNEVTSYYHAEKILKFIKNGNQN